jgi:hypothetical protein
MTPGSAPGNGQGPLTARESWIGYPVGGEAKNYGNFITSVRNANLGVTRALAAIKP